MSSAVPPSPPVTDTPTNSQEVMVSRIIGGAILAAIAIYVLVAGAAVALPSIFLLLPLMIGAVIMLISSDEVTGKTESWSESHEQGLDSARSSTGTFARWFKRPLYGGFALLWKATRNVDYRHVRAALRVTGLLYFAGLMIYLLIMAVYIVLALLFVGVILWIVIKVAGSNNNKVPTTSGLPFLGRSGRSVRREGLTGPYVEHYDEDGEKIGESREREGIFHRYTEHTNKDGEKIGESQEREGIFHDYVEHTDQDGEKTGESREREGIFHDYTEHTNKDGDKVGESREREGIFHDYVEHTKE